MYVNSLAVRWVAGGPSASTTCARDMPGEMTRSVCCASSIVGRQSRERTIERRMGRSSSGSDALENGFEERESVGGSQHRVHGALGVGHHAEHVALRTDDPGD